MSTPNASSAPRIALVTGGGSGLGAAIVRRLHADGLVVVVNDVRPAAAEALAAEVDGRAAPFDVTDTAAFDAAVDAVVDEHGRIDVLVNNAGIIDHRPDVLERSVVATMARAEGRDAEPISSLSTLSDAAFDRMMRVHVYGTFHGTRAALRHMEVARRGAVVNVASVFGLRGSANTPAYAAAKHAIVGLTRSAGLEVAPLGVRVNAVAPGFIDTPLLEPLGDFREVLRQQVPADRLGRAEEVAAAVSFLAGPDASYCHGEVLALTGGFRV